MLKPDRWHLQLDGHCDLLTTAELAAFDGSLQRLLDLPLRGYAGFFKKFPDFHVDDIFIHGCSPCDFPPVAG